MYSQKHIVFYSNEMIGEKLKILQVTPFYYPAWAYGGAPRIVYELSGALAKRGHDVTVYTTDVLDEASRYSCNDNRANVEGVKVIYFKNLSNSLAYNHQGYLPLGLMKTVRESLSGFDVIHLHCHRHLLNNIVRHFAVKLKKPYIFSAHGTVLRIQRKIFIKALYDILLGNRILKHASHFVAVSEREAIQYQNSGVHKDIISVIYNGIDAHNFDDLPAKNIFRNQYGLKDSKVILYLGRISSEKGLDFLVRAFSSIRRDDTVLVIAGNDMGFKKNVEKVIESEHASGKVIFSGLLEGDMKKAAYQDADLVVLPSSHEIFGLVPFEAIMCGSPVIVTDTCGCSEIIGKEDIGYVVKYNDLNGLRQKIMDILENRDIAMGKVKKGQKFIKNALSWEGTGYRYEQLYMDIVLKK